jgi:TIR domain
LSVESSALKVERSGAGKAVFLSYASQNAEAAKRSCNALRQAGVEVWFERDELVGGDAWDRKIHRQNGRTHA